MPATRFVLVAAMLLGSQAAEVTTLQKVSMILPPILFASVGYGFRERVAFGEEVIKVHDLYDGKGGKLGKTKEEYAAAFIPEKLCTDADWQGTLIDMFSPDDTNPDSRRFLDFAEEAGELQVSADTGGEKWGRRFDKTTSVNPVLAPTGESCVRKTSFLSKVPPEAPVYKEAMDGALDFTLELGTAFGEKVIKWNGLYDGKGGKFGGNTVPASDSDNFWRYVSETAAKAKARARARARAKATRARAKAKARARS